MSDSQRSSATRQAEPEFETNWSAIFIVLGLGVFLATGIMIGRYWRPDRFVANQSDSHPAQPEGVAPPLGTGTSLAQVQAERAASLKRMLASKPAPRRLYPVQEKVESTEAPSPPEVTSKRLVANEDTLIRRQREFIEPLDVHTSIQAAASSVEFRPHNAKTSPGTRNPTRRSQYVLNAVRQSAATRKTTTGLPFLGEDECRKDPRQVAMMAAVSRDLGRAFSSSRALASRPSVSPPRNSRSAASLEFRTSFSSGGNHQAMRLMSQESWHRPDAVSSLVQIIQVQQDPLRFNLIHVLSDINGAEATDALVDRAVFDPSPDVRKVARENLKNRQRTQVRRRLLKRFRYPWAPVSAFAAQALVEIDDQRAVSELVDLLDMPNPDHPFLNDEGGFMKRELVRINHFRNCVACHAVSDSSRDSVRGVIPIPGQRIPVAYYGSPFGSAVRADITYLRQDFSLMHEVEKAKPWPSQQRFDYVVRTRPADASEMLAHELEAEWNARQMPADESEAARQDSYPQREAVLFALRGLTGTDAGSTSEEWRRFVAGRMAVATPLGNQLRRSR